MAWFMLSNNEVICILNGAIPMSMKYIPMLDHHTSVSYRSVTPQGHLPLTGLPPRLLPLQPLICSLSLLLYLF